MRPRLCVLGAIAAAATAGPADASPFGDPAIERAVFSGATASRPDSPLINPAALTLGASGWYLHAGASSTLDRISIDRRTVDPDTGGLLDGSSATDTLWSPGGSIGVYGVGGEFAVGVQVALPSGEEHVDGGDLLGYHARGGRHRDYDLVVFGGGFRRGGLAIGASVRLVETHVSLRFDRDTALEAGRAGTAADCDGGPCGLENPAARERYGVDVETDWLDTQSFAVSFGAVARLAEGWWLGLAYHLPQGTFARVEAEGTVEVERAPRDGGGTVEGSATVLFTLPQRLRAGVRGRVLPRIELVGELRWDRLGGFDRYDVRLHGLELSDAGIPEVFARPRGLRDDVGIQVGVEQVDVGQTWLTGARLGLERGAVAEERVSPLNLRTTAVTFDVGVQARPAPSWVITLGYGLAWSPTADTGRGAYDPIDRLDCVDQGFDVDTPACEAVAAGYAIPTASGVYGRAAHAARLTVRWAFR